MKYNHMEDIWIKSNTPTTNNNNNNNNNKTCISIKSLWKKLKNAFNFK